MDEISAAMAVVTSAMPFIPRVRAFLKRQWLRLFPRRGVECSCAKCVPCGCYHCDKNTAAKELGEWIKTVAPRLIAGGDRGAV